jgi:glycosyltransferase 2 family protein
VNPRLGRAIRWIVTGAIVVFLVLFARTIDWTSAWRSIRSASLPLLAAALAANFLTVVVKAARWWIFLRPAGSPSYPLALRATIAGAGLNNVLVANGGDAARVVFVSRATGIPSSRILATLALERMFDPVGFVVLLVYGVVAYSLPPVLDRWRIPAEVALAIMTVLLVWFVYTSRRVGPEGFAAERTHGGGTWQRLKAYLAGFMVSTRSLTTGPRFVAALVLSLLGWITQVYTFEYAAAAAHISMPEGASLAALLATNIGLLIRATPGNVGFFQFVYALSTAPFGIPRDAAIAVSLLIQTLQIVPMTLLGVALAPEFIFRKRREGTQETPPGSV